MAGAAEDAAAVGFGSLCVGLLGARPDALTGAAGRGDAADDGTAEALGGLATLDPISIPAIGSVGGDGPFG
jgi:hypothetical protein